MTSTTTRRELFKLGTSAAAYAAGAGFVAGGVALASEAKGETPATAPAADPLRPFALAWLAQWREKGGSVLPDPSQAGRYHFGWPEYFESPVHEDDKARRSPAMSEDATNRANSWCDAHYMGTMRALYDVLKATPGGTDAVKAIVAEYPVQGWPRLAKGGEA